MQEREIGSVALSVWIWCVSGEGTAHNTMCQEYSLGGKEEVLAVTLGLSLQVPEVMEEPVVPAPTLSCTVYVCPCVLSPVRSRRGGFYTPTEVSVKLRHCSEEGWHQQVG